MLSESWILKSGSSKMFANVLVYSGLKFCYSRTSFNIPTKELNLQACSGLFSSHPGDVNRKIWLSNQSKSIKVDRSDWSNQSKSIVVIVEAIEVDRRFTFCWSFDWLRLASISFAWLRSTSIDIARIWLKLSWNLMVKRARLHLHTPFSYCYEVTQLSTFCWKI